MDEFTEILKFVSSYLNDHGIEYVIVGGVAVMYHGVPRTTVDIDILLQIDDAEIDSFSDFLNSKGFNASADDMRSALIEGSYSTIFYMDTLLRLDLQGVISTFDRLTIERAVAIEFLEVSIKLGTAEDTIVNKVLFQGEQDIRDAHGIFQINRERLDMSYIESTCKMLGISDKWNSFLSESEKWTLK
ncbi:MAG: hypothetical protein AM326_01195 [Candidatus Thorarchaeota archaeon SMTZ-45]|nr:MAG: hypothetical protein AM326_01195 [Candidatus Thorarchaeota archaeon SMTZ-45]